MFPLEKYVYVIKGRTVKALQTYAGRIYAGYAKCAPEDEFDFKKGRELAAARCNEKIAKARYAYARKKFEKAFELKEKAMRQWEKYWHFLNDSDDAYTEAICKKEAIEEELGVEFDGIED